jgi:monoterpene epsilon-lactone hydrolase
MEDEMSSAQRAALAAELRNGPQDEGGQSVEQMRAGFAGLMARFPVPEDVRRTATSIGARPAVLVEPIEHSHVGTILYFHGGSFSLGSPETAMVLTADLVRRTGVRAISVDYRLAPEHPFPAAIEDGVAAYRSLLDDGADPGSIVFAGDSAGGGLTVTVCLAARDSGLPVPAALLAFSPALDHTRSGDSMRTKEGVDPFFTREGVRRTGELYLGGADPEQPLLAPALHADLRGFPPMLLQVGTDELLLDDSTRMAARARAQEVDVILDVVARVPHVFPAYVSALDEAGQALDRAALFLTQHLAAG